MTGVFFGDSIHQHMQPLIDPDWSIRKQRMQCGRLIYRARQQGLNLTTAATVHRQAANRSQLFNSFSEKENKNGQEQGNPRAVCAST
jgi:hypothetical protein